MLLDGTVNSKQMDAWGQAVDHCDEKDFRYSPKRARFCGKINLSILAPDWPKITSNLQLLVIFRADSDRLLVDAVAAQEFRNLKVPLTAEMLRASFMYERSRVFNQAPGSLQSESNRLTFVRPVSADVLAFLRCSVHF